ncbi:MAG: polysaccharide biosynthesis protein [Bdellovibrionales bacterium]|nr:polysaccharide biosynthesis protein [Bdellovibrionales bacterium]
MQSKFGVPMIFEGKKVLVTGGTGSMGKIFVHRVLSGEHGNPKKVIVLSRDEAKQHDMRVSYMTKIMGMDEAVYENFNKCLEFRIGDIRNFDDVCSAVKGVDIVVNAAALKQVPSCEYFPHQGVLTNCIGAQNIVRAIQENDYPVETVVGISTDKAAKPVNAMGMTKALMEKIFTSANILNKNTRFICVRYGNVLASRGSVIPLFHKQIESGGPVTITVPSMTRFLISINKAVDTVFAAIRDAEPGEIFIPIAPAATVENIAKALIGNQNIKIEITGIRPAEKMHEILISDEEAPFTVKKGSYFAVRSMLPELRGDLSSEERILNCEYSSSDTVLNLDETVALLTKNNLMKVRSEPQVELLR